MSVISKHFVVYSDTSTAMDYNLVRGDEQVYQKLEKLQYGLVISNIIMLIVALANFSICIWIRSKSTMFLELFILIILGLILISGNGFWK